MAELRACDCGAVDSVRAAAFPVLIMPDERIGFAARVVCSRCGRLGPVVQAQAKDAALAAAIAGWNARPAEDALRALLRQARDMLGRNVPRSVSYAYEEDFCAVCGAQMSEGPEDDDFALRHPEGHPGCAYVQLLAAIDAALDGSHE